MAIKPLFCPAWSGAHCLKSPRWTPKPKAAGPSLHRAVVLPTTGCKRGGRRSRNIPQRSCPFSVDHERQHAGKCVLPGSTWPIHIATKFKVCPHLLETLQWGGCRIPPGTVDMNDFSWPRSEERLEKAGPYTSHGEHLLGSAPSPVSSRRDLFGVNL